MRSNIVQDKIFIYLINNELLRLKICLFKKYIFYLQREKQNDELWNTVCNWQIIISR